MLVIYGERANINPPPLVSWDFLDMSQCTEMMETKRKKTKMKKTMAMNKVDICWSLCFLMINFIIVHALLLNIRFLVRTMTRSTGKLGVSAKCNKLLQPTSSKSLDHSLPMVIKRHLR